MDTPFAVSAWVRLDEDTGRQTVFAQKSSGGDEPVIELVFTGGPTGQWQFSMAGPDGRTRVTAGIDGEDLTGWHHLVAVYDLNGRQIKLHLDGGPAATAQLPSDFRARQSAAPLLVGRSSRAQSPSWLHGSIDDVTVFQGSITSAAASVLYQREADK